jgi:hypothetical protein
MRFRRKGADDEAAADETDRSAPGGDINADAPPDVAGPGVASPQGPWDASDVADDVSRLDFGALLVPAVDGMEVRLDVDEQGAVNAVAVALADTALQMQAFAAPRSSGLWQEVRGEMVEGIRASGGTVREAEGPFGPELQAELPAQGPDGSVVGQEPVRFLGVDGPRWFLRAVVTGPGATDAARAEPVLTLLRGVVVVRGDVAAPPRELLELRMPDDPALRPGPAADG